MKKRKLINQLLVGSIIFSTFATNAIAAVATETSESTIKLTDEARMLTLPNEFIPSSQNQDAKSQTEASSETIEEAVKETVKLTFKAANDHIFSNGQAVSEIQGYLADQFLTIDVPKLLINETVETFEGWELNGTLFSEQELKQQVLGADVTLTAVVKKKVVTAQSRALNESIADIIKNADTTKTIVIPSPTGSDAYKEYTANDTNLKVALSEMYHNGDGRDFTIYVGSNFSLTASTVAKVVPADVNATNATFYALQGKVGTITLTGAATDPINMNTTTPVNVRTINLSTGGIYFGTNMIIRNLVYQGNIIYMGGRNLSLNGGASGNGFTIYGGTDAGDLTASPTLEVNTTGTGTWNFYGGNQTSGTLTGNPEIVINQTTNGLNEVVGGARVGSINGNTSIVINGVNGAISQIYSGGYGDNYTNSKANVTGDVSLTSIAPVGSKIQFGTIHGGVRYGDIGGSVSTTISGNAAWNGYVVNFYGGSEQGNIGSTVNGPAITTNIDSSNFTTGRATFTGANNLQGTITGNITNKIKAGTASAGGFNDVNGGGGNSIARVTRAALLGGATEAVYDAKTPEQRAVLAEAAATFKVYGNISTHLVSGAFSYGNNYSTAAGRGGYIQGNTSIEVGTANADGSTGGQGLAYRTIPATLGYSTTEKTRGLVTDWDIVGGGGYPSGTGIWDIYIKGNTKTVINNAVARWTYGGGYSGIIEGNTSNTMNGGIVDTLEGTGYMGGRVFGNGQSTINNGQIDWFLTGGSWDDAKVVGDVGVTVYDGTINASMGASYGVNAAHTVTGNSNNIIYGGDFSGTPRTGNNVFSGGVTNNGTLQGNANLTIDLRAYNGTFKLPTGTSISGGVPFNVATNLGTSVNNTITLNIYTKSGTDVLNGANIYGDAAYYATNTKSGKITMNIDAPESTIGNLYATRYSNISGGAILRDVEVNVQRASEINGISGGAAIDNFTNTIVKASSHKSHFTFGAKLANSTAYQVPPINVTGSGIVNFTSLKVQNNTTVTANGGNILNGRNATATDHGVTYSEFGDITLTENAGLGITKSTNYISVGKMTIDGQVRLFSPPGKGKVNISDFIYDNEQTDRLTWIKTTANDSASMVASSGTWFGSRNAFQVLTINPTAANAKKVTPFIFLGIEESTGKTFIGDNDVTKGADGYGIAIPGSVIDYEVHNPIQDGIGDIMHNVTSVLEGNTPVPLKVWGTEVAGTKVQRGRLVIPSGENILPTLTFTPETAVTGSWLYSGKITSSAINSNDITIPEQSNSSPVTWKSADNTYSYSVKVQYSNKVEVTAQNVIITESEAAAINNATDLAVYTKGAGRPFLETNLTEAMLTDIRHPLDSDQLSRATAVTYRGGTVADNQAEKTVNVVVVKDQTEIAGSRQFAVYAQDGVMNLAQANALTNQGQLEMTVTKPLTIFADGTTGAAESDPQTFTAIKNTTEAELLKIVKIAYSYSLDEEKVVKEIEVKITGILEINQVPTTFNFGEQTITNQEKTYWPTIVGDLVIKDTRGTEKQAWQLMLKEETALTNGSQNLANRMSFVDGTEQAITGENILIKTHTLTNNGTYNVTESWSEGQKGIKLRVPVKQQKVGQYSGTLSWSLVDGPAND